MIVNAGVCVYDSACLRKNIIAQALEKVFASAEAFEMKFILTAILILAAATASAQFATTVHLHTPIVNASASFQHFLERTLWAVGSICIIWGIRRYRQQKGGSKRKTGPIILITAGFILASLPFLQTLAQSYVAKHQAPAADPYNGMYDLFESDNVKPTPPTDAILVEKLPLDRNGMQTFSTQLEERYPVGSPEKKLISDFILQNFQERSYSGSRQNCIPRTLFADVHRKEASCPDKPAFAHAHVDWCADKAGNITWLHGAFDVDSLDCI